MVQSGRKLHLRGDVQQLAKAITLVQEGARRAGLTARRRDALESAAREGYLAIVDACQRGGHKTPVEVEVSWDDRGIEVALRHSGASLGSLFDRIPLDPRIEAMRAAVDEVRYVSGSRHGNQLSLGMRIAETAARARRDAQARPPRPRARRSA